MQPNYPKPTDLVQALHQSSSSARLQLWCQLRDPVSRLVHDLVARHGLSSPPDLLTARALHAVEIYLRTRDPLAWKDANWASFLAALLLHLAKMTLHPIGGPPPKQAEPDPLPECPDFETRAFFLPYEQVGDYPTGGDWFGGARASDGSLWVFVGDVTGHGYSAYLVASGLPDVWRTCWDGLASDSCQPAALLGAIHVLLEGCLPEGVYVEATLARLRPDGQVTVAPAGGIRILSRSDGAAAALHTLQGGWLGLAPPDSADQRTWSLSPRDELMLGSDGLFDQLLNLSSLPETWSDLFAGGNGLDSLFDAVNRVLQEALREQPQIDDITMILVRRADTTAGGNA
jgi:hypothetical protein